MRGAPASKRTRPTRRGAPPARGGTRRIRGGVAERSRSSASPAEPRTKSGSRGRTSSHVVTPVPPCSSSISVSARPPSGAIAPAAAAALPGSGSSRCPRGSLRGRRSRRSSSRRGTRARGRRAAPGGSDDIARRARSVRSRVTAWSSGPGAWSASSRPIHVLQRAHLQHPPPDRVDRERPRHQQDPRLELPPRAVVALRAPPELDERVLDEVLRRGVVAEHHEPEPVDPARRTADRARPPRRGPARRTTASGAGRRRAPSTSPGRRTYTASAHTKGYERRGRAGSLRRRRGCGAEPRRRAPHRAPRRGSPKRATSTAESASGRHERELRGSPDDRGVGLLVRGWHLAGSEAPVPRALRRRPPRRSGRCSRSGRGRPGPAPRGACGPPCRSSGRSASAGTRDRARWWLACPRRGSTTRPSVTGRGSAPRSRRRARGSVSSPSPPRRGGRRRRGSASAALPHVTSTSRVGRPDRRSTTHSLNALDGERLPVQVEPGTPRAPRRGLP